MNRTNHTCVIRKVFIQFVKGAKIIRRGVSPVLLIPVLILHLFPPPLLPSAKQWKTRRPRPVTAHFAASCSTGNWTRRNYTGFNPPGRSRADSATNEKTETRQSGMRWSDGKDQKNYSAVRVILGDSDIYSLKDTLKNDDVDIYTSRRSSRRSLCLRIALAKRIAKEYTGYRKHRQTGLFYFCVGKILYLC